MTVGGENRERRRTLGKIAGTRSAELAHPLSLPSQAPLAQTKPTDSPQAPAGSPEQADPPRDRRGPACGQPSETDARLRTKAVEQVSRSSKASHASSRMGPNEKGPPVEWRGLTAFVAKQRSEVAPASALRRRRAPSAPGPRSPCRLRPPFGFPSIVIATGDLSESTAATNMRIALPCCLPPLL